MKLRICLLLVCACLAARTAPAPNQLEVRTFPDQYRDDRNGSVFADAQFNIILHTWARKAPFTAGDVTVRLTLPKNLRIRHFSICRRSRPAGAIQQTALSEDQNLWTLQAGQIHFSAVYRLSRHPWRPEVPWTESSVVIFLKPEGRIPEQFSIPWEIQSADMEKCSGVMKLHTLPAPRLQGRSRNQTAWSGPGIYALKESCGGWNEEVYRSALKIMGDAGISGLVESGGRWLPKDILAVPALKKEFGLDAVAMNCLSYSQRITPEKMRSLGYACTAGDIKINAAGRAMSEPGQRAKQIWCYSAMLEKDSPVRAYMRAFYQKYIDRGFRTFFTDYEPRIYDCCYCPKCRRAFCEFISGDLQKCLKSSPGDLVAAHPWEWYLFRCRLHGRLLQLLSRELKVSIGWNSNLVHNSRYLSPMQSFGWSEFAEDPRIMDPYVSFHEADTLATGVGSVEGVRSFLQLASSGKPVLSKPVIASASSLHWVNWGYHCIYGRYDFAISRKFKGLGVDFRRQLQKLEIANDFALGVSGVSLSADPFSTDAEALTGITEGLQFALDFEDYLTAVSLLPDNCLQIYDCTGTPSPYNQKMSEGYLSNWFKEVTDKLGVIHYAVHSGPDWQMAAVFNWDYYQDKLLRIVFTRNIPDAKYLNISIDNRKYCREIPCSPEEQRRGIMLRLPAGAMAGILLSTRPVFPLRQENAPEHAEGKLISRPDSPRLEQGTAPFIRHTYNPHMRRLRKKYPAAGFREIEVRP